MYLIWAEKTSIARIAWLTVLLIDRTGFFSFIGAKTSIGNEFITFTTQKTRRKSCKIWTELKSLAQAKAQVRPPISL